MTQFFSVHFTFPPAFKTKHPDFCEQKRTIDDGINSLIKDGFLLQDFYETAVCDSEWSSGHSIQLTKMNESLIEAAAKGSLSLDTARQVYSFINKKEPFNKHMKTLDVIVSDEPDSKIQLQTLLFHAASPVASMPAFSDGLNNGALIISSREKDSFRLLQLGLENKEQLINELTHYSFDDLLDVHRLMSHYKIDDLQKIIEEEISKKAEKCNPYPLKELTKQALVSGSDFLFKTAIAHLNACVIGRFIPEEQCVKISFAEGFFGVDEVLRKQTLPFFSALAELAKQEGIIGDIHISFRTSINSENKNAVDCILNQFNGFVTKADVDLSYLSAATADIKQVRTALGKFRNLKQLRLIGDASWFDGNAFSCMFEGLTRHLSSLVIEGSTALTGEDMIRQLKRFTHIEELVLYGSVSGLGDQLLEELSHPERHEAFRSLGIDFVGDDDFSEEKLKELARCKETFNNLRLYNSSLTPTYIEIAEDGSTTLNDVYQKTIIHTLQNITGRVFN